MLVHLDSSVVAAALLEEPARLQLAGLSASELFLSDLGSVEVRRVLHRLRLNQQYTDEQVADRLLTLAEMEKSFTFLEITREILARASGSFPVQVRTLDAIHLATAALNSAASGGEPVTFATHDARLGRAARSLDFHVIGAGNE